MPLGPTVRNVEVAIAGAGAPALGTSFVVVEADSGPVGPVLVRNMSEYVAVYGPRSETSSVSYDWAETFFKLGGQRLYCTRAIGAGAENAKVELEDSSSKPTLAVSAVDKGTGGNGLKVTVTTSGSDVKLSIIQNEAVVQTSPVLATQAAVIAWAASNQVYVKIVASTASEHTTNLPVAGTFPLTGGTDGSAITDVERIEALALCDRTYGPGHEAIPGSTTEAAHEGLASHAASLLRIAVLDPSDSDAPETLINSVNTVPAGAKEYTTATSGSVRIPGIAAGTTRTVRGSAALCGLRGAVARQGNNNTAAAGTEWLVSPFVSSPVNTFSREQQETLVEAGVNPWAEVQGGIALYGFSTLASKETSPVFWSLAASCERMALDYEGEQILETFQFQPITPETETSIKGELEGLISRHWSLGALYGLTATEAGEAEVVPNLAAEQLGEVQAQIDVRISPFIQSSLLLVIARPITESLA